MKNKILTLICFLGVIILHSQSKKELIDAIKKVNSLDGWDGTLNPQLEENGTCSYHNYYNFEKLKKKLSKEELIELTYHENQVLRLYAIRALIEQNYSELDLRHIIIEEVIKNEKIQTQRGCVIGKEYIYSIIYHDYWNQVWSNALINSKIDDEKTKEQMRLNAIKNDKKLMEINEAILCLDKDVYWLVYDRIFEVEKYDESLNSKIEELLFKYNNSYAYLYLQKNNKSSFQEISNKYFADIFPNQEFNEENQIFYLFDFTKYAFENEDTAMQEIILKKLRSTHAWKEIMGGAFSRQIFDKYKVQL